MSNKNRALKAIKTQKPKNNVAIVGGGDNGMGTENTEYLNSRNKLKIHKSEMKISQKRKTLSEEDLKYGFLFMFFFGEVCGDKFTS